MDTVLDSQTEEVETDKQASSRWCIVLLCHLVWRDYLWIIIEADISMETNTLM